MRIGNRDFELGKRTYIMGILNITPDSFSDGGRYSSVDIAVKHALDMVAQGADIIDIGGESTRPNHAEVDAQIEINRVVPVIAALRKVSDIPISIDTSKAEVAEAAILAGADLVNDVWGFKRDQNIAKVTAKYELPCCLMHNRENLDYNNLIDDIISDLNESVDIAIAGGVKKSNIIIDCGIGFAKSYEQNIEVMQNLAKFKVLGLPMLLGTSRKSFIGLALSEDVNNRLEGTIATTVLGIAYGCDFVRVHDVSANARAAKMTDKIVR